MDEATILILGGYGNAGRKIAQLLLQATAVKHIIIAGRHAQKAQELSDKLASKFGRTRVSAHAVDAGDEAGLRKAVAQTDLVIVCLGYRGNQAEIMLRVVLDSGIHYIDLTPDKEKQALFGSQANQLASRGCIVLTEAGIIPGCPSVLTRLAAKKFDKVTNVTLASLYRDRDMAYAGAYDLISHARQQPAAVYEQGQWRRASLLRLRRIFFGDRFGYQLALPVSLNELGSLPKRLKIEQLRLYQGSLNPVTDTILLLWQIFSLLQSERLAKLVTRLLLWSIRHFTRPPFGIVQRIVAEGMRNGRSRQFTFTLSQTDMYLATAIPVVAAAGQILQGLITQSGLQFMGHAVQLLPFIKEMERLGMGLLSPDLNRS